MSKWLDQHHCSVRLQRLERMRSGSHRITHIMKAIEKGNQVEAIAGKLLRGRDLEANVV